MQAGMAIDPWADQHLKQNNTDDTNDLAEKW